MAPLTGTHVLIIGGTSGIGLSVAHHAAASGARVTVASSNQSRISAAVSALQSTHPSASIYGHVLDLSLPAAAPGKIEALFAFAAGLQSLNHVVYTAGDRIPLMPLVSQGPESVEAATRLRLYGPVLVAQAAAKYLPPTADNSLTITGGATAVRPPGDGWAVASFIAAGTTGLVRALAVEMKPVRVNCVQAGVVETELWDAAVETEEQKKKLMDQMAQHTLVGRVGRPEDVAEAYGWLMRDGFVTATVAGSDGGYIVA